MEETNFTTTTIGSSNASSGLAIGNAEGENNTKREHMFHKVVTPSDVGKLNRLVIPKQHAEKYFPLDTSCNEKDLLLNFEDSTGNPWRFRYSYWNSSQSYVMTKGWSRFVKEKKLDAGDIVSFERSVSQSNENRMFISWKRRPELPPERPTLLGSRLFWPVVSGQPAPLVPSLRPSYYDYCTYGLRYVEPTSSPVHYLRARTAPRLAETRDHSAVARVGLLETILDSAQVIQGNAAAKRVRLFGVNLEYTTETEDADEENTLSIRGGCDVAGGGCDGDGSCSSMPNWLPQSPSHLQLRLHCGDNSQISLATNPLLNVSQKAKPPSLSFDL